MKTYYKLNINMSESTELNMLYAILQIAGVLAFFMLCLTCLYKKGMRDRENNNKIHDSSSKNIQSRLESLEKKIRELETKSCKLSTIV